MLALDRALSLEREHDGNVAVTVITTASSDVQIQNTRENMGIWCCPQPQLVEPLLLDIYRLASNAKPSPATTQRIAIPFSRCALRAPSCPGGRPKRLQPGYVVIMHA